MTLATASISPTYGFRIDGAAAGDHSGWSVASAGSVAQIGLSSKLPFPRAELCHALRDRCSEGGETVQYGCPDLKLGNLSVEVA